jgi:hypothetical protein
VDKVLPDIENRRNAGGAWGGNGCIAWPGKNVRTGEIVRLAMLQTRKRGIRQYDPFLKTLQEAEKRFK